jgi:FAD/FMN-containing dehydrogenase
MSGFVAGAGMAPQIAHGARAVRAAIAAKGPDMGTHATAIAAELTANDVSTFARQFSGEVVRPEDAAYDQTRQVWNAAVDRFPALIVRPRNASDVIHAIAFAREHDLPLAVRGGGHSVAGHGVIDDGLVVDLSAMTRYTLDPDRRIATVESGLTWGEFVARSHADGLATPGPDVGAVGLGGLTLGGGFGWLSRLHGLTIDNLMSAEAVTADGQLVTASDTENGDLFWALRGGGGNFGIATTFQFQMHPLQTVVGGALIYPAQREVLRDYAAAAAAVPDNLATLALVQQAPPLPFIPPHAHGKPALMIIACYAGDPEASEQAYAPLRRLGGHTPLADTVDAMPYPALFELTTMAATRRPQAIRAGFMTDLDETTIDAVLDAVTHATSPFSGVMLRVLGGAIARVPDEATAFSHRDKPLYFAIGNSWDGTLDPRSERHIAWTESLWQVLAPRTAGAYANYLGDEGPERVAAAYSPGTYARLAAIKRRYDPDNVFRLNANVVPA